MKEFQFVSGSEEETREIASLLSPLFRAGDVIVLDGELGAGKTCFVKGFAEARGCTGEVTSPTFSIANFYRTTGEEILHVDLYRVETTGEYEDLGLEDYFPRVVTLVEWGLKFPGWLDASLVVSFRREAGSDRRVMTFRCPGERLDVEKLASRLTLFPC
ncbi:MAG: tRNA (adenosine(37)-N6)-threonylcarbamoyltransferase complex ATPase subunit type 1 TsaE [Odoribacteraceae bacterium]|jgi:tRNA threonylcarbamoyladenosine biosynthesis protein TsaE|nr:tRNA (adenosine(37)-N6)-threonylcarbamoyltransferase complex ATPase subunit type 1 TsaE [Odoribacteraceae bacterium]